MDDIYFDRVYRDKDTSQLVSLTYGSFIIKVKDSNKWEDAVIYKIEGDKQAYAMSLTSFKKHFELVMRMSEKEE